MGKSRHTFQQLALAALLALQTTIAHAAIERLRIEVDGKVRQVMVHVPNGASDTPRPFVVIFHGLGDNNTTFANAVKFEKAWQGAIVAYPNGEPRPDRASQRGWQTRAGQYDDRDLRLVDKLLAEAASRYDIRPESTYAAGFSNGGHLVFLLMAERPHAFAAFAVIGSVRPDLAGASTARPLMYLWGRNESREFSDDWAATVKAMARLNRTHGALLDYTDCCKYGTPDSRGAPFVFGLYNEGHVWPYRGSQWLRTFFTQDWSAPIDNE